MARRCYSEVLIEGSTAMLTGSEAHHLLHVLRASPGMNVVLFDGSGAEFDAEVTTCRRSDVELRVLERREVNRELPFSLVLGVALPKGDRQRWIVEKSVELGVTQLVPLITERSEKPSADKLVRYVVEASKQCGRNRLMEIGEPLPWSAWLQCPAILAGDNSPVAARRWVAHPGGQPIGLADRTTARPTRLAIGPEGGFTDAEIAEALIAGWEAISLGPRILRIETAAIALVSSLTLAMTGKFETADERG